MSEKIKDRQQKKDEPNVGVVIIARDEEENIGSVLDALMNQSFRPTSIVLVNDNSKDKTKQIAQSYGITVVDFPYNHENWVISGKLAKVFNLGFQTISKKLDYYMILGGDTVLSKDYIELVIYKMRKENCDIASGVIENEKGDLRGSGRIMSINLMKSQNFAYRENYGYETYMIFRARYDGFKTCIENKARSKVTRKTGTFYNSVKLYHRGCAYRSLGYSFPFTFALAVKLYLKNPRFFLSFLQGWFACPKSSFYEEELRRFTKNYERERIRKIFKN